MAGWTKDMKCVNTEEFHSVTKQRKAVSLSKKQMGLEVIVISKINQN